MSRSLLQIGGHTIAADVHLREDGRIPVVFLHGMMASVAVGRELFRQPDGESWIALSLPGHHPGRFPPGLGRTAIDMNLFADLVEDALGRIVGHRPVIVAGWSTGGFAAVGLAIRHPHRVAGLATLAGFSRGRLCGSMGWLQWLARGAGGSLILRSGLAAVARSPAAHRWWVGSFAADPAMTLPDGTLSRMFRDFARHDVRSIVELLAALDACDASNCLAGIGAPTLVAAGELDPLVPLEEARILAEGIPQALVRVYPGAGHLFFCEWPSFADDFAAWRTAVENGRTTPVDRCAQPLS